jgi:hypothetical protein
MYIIDKRRTDYYDGVVGTMGIDKTIVFERKEREIEPNNLNEIPKEFISKGYRDINPLANFDDFSLKHNCGFHKYSPIIVGFCGKLYVGWKLFYKTKSNKLSNEETKIIITYNYDHVKHIIHNKSWHLNLYDCINYIKNYDAMHIFRKFNTPTFIFDYNHNNVDWASERDINRMFYINPILNTYSFYKVFDSFLAFQEIQMFISGVLGSNENQIIEIEDKYKIEQHGFDKHSFRKDKQVK